MFSISPIKSRRFLRLSGALIIDEKGTINNKKNSPSYHLFLISINFKKLSSTKSKFFNFINKKGIYPQFHYMPIFKFSFYKNQNNTKYIGASNYYKNVLSLPIYFNLKKNEQLHIIKSLIQFIDKNKKR